MNSARTWWRARPLASQILVWTLCILLLTVTLGGFVTSRILRQNLDDEYRQRALGIATTFAQTPEVATELQRHDPSARIQALADRVRAQAHPDYVVVTDLDGVRFSHPNPLLIGKKLEEPLAVLDGKSHVGTDPGSLGPSANAKAPLFDASGKLIGQVSVGILEASVDTADWADVSLVAGYSGLVLLIGAAGSLLLARGIKRVTFGLEPPEIASLLQEREALLHGIREAMVGLDDDGHVTVINSEARRLLGLDAAVLGRPIGELLPEGRLLEVLGGRSPGDDQMVITDDALLVANRRPVSVAGRSIGAVVTLRDRTEVEVLVRDLRATEGLIEALRAQEHEYANRLHVVTGLLDEGDVEQARKFVSSISDTSRSLGEGLRSRVEPPELAALILAKVTIAAEQDVTLTVTEDSRLRQPEVTTAELLTVIGNLLDNAIDAVVGQDGDRTVTLQLDDSSGVFVAVTDTGPGVPAELVGEVFRDGFSTKEARPGMRRGIGLALVARIVRRAGGTLDVFPGPGGRFEVWLPGTAADEEMG